MYSTFASIIKYCLLLSLIFSLTILSACGGKEKKIAPSAIKPVKVFMTKQAISLVQRRFPAQVIAAQQATLSLEVAGTIIQLPIKEGQDVEIGALLLELDAQTFINSLQKARATYNQAAAEYRRAKELIKNHHISQADFDKKHARFEATDAALNTAQYDLNTTRLISPFTGTISAIYVENHEYVNAKQPLVLLQDLSYIDIAIHIPENIMVNLEKGDENNNSDLKVIFDAVPNEVFYPQYKEHSSQADAKTQTYNVVFTMIKPTSYNILPGMSATILAMLPDIQNNSASFIEIPSAAVFTNKQGHATVWIIQSDMTIKPQSITTGKLDNDRIQVLEGLQPGQVIVAAGVHFLRSGDKVLAVY